MRIMRNIMDKNKVVGVGVICILLVSMFFLANMLLNEHNCLEPTSPLRFTAFTVDHILMIFMMVWLMFIEEVYGYVQWAFALSLGNSLLLTGTELIIFTQRSGIYGRVYSSTSQN